MGVLIVPVERTIARKIAVLPENHILSFPNIISGRSDGAIRTGLVDGSLM
jgi:hypothetical protein